MAVGDAILNLTGLRRLRILRQAEAAECGLACIGMVAGYYGYQTDLNALRREHPVSLKGSTLKDVIDISARIGLGGRAVRCELEELKNLRLPAILHWNMNHFVVLKSASRNKLVILDPARGQMSAKLQDVSENFTGVALELAPTATFQRKRERQPVRLSSLVRLDGVTWGALCQGLVLSLLLQVFVLLTPYFMQLVIDEAILKSDISLLGAVAIGFGMLKLFEVATTIVRGLVFQFLSNVLTYDMKASLFHHMTRLPLAYFHRRHVGDIQQRFQSLQPICNLVVNGAIASMIDGVLAITIGALLFAYNLYLALIVVGCLTLYAVLRLASLEMSKRLAGDLLVAQAKESTKFLETLRAMQPIKIASAENSRESGWRNLAADSINATIRVGNVNIGFDAVSQAILGFSTIGVVFIAAQSAIGGTMTVGMITAFMAYKGQLEQRITTLIEQYMNWKMLDVHLERVADIALHERENGIDAPALEREFKGKIEIRDLRFRYAPHEADILNSVTLSIQPGQFVAISGPSGSGKSTLLRLLTGLYQPSIGQMLYDGMPLSTWGPKAIRDQIGVVMQDDTLLAGSIAENIAMFDEHIDMERVHEVAKIACVHDDIERMPMSYRSLVGDMGSSLSGGQQQRVMLARALYRRPKLLVMDEATAHLDVAMEKRINENLKSLGITRIVAAHRPDTLASADRRISLVGGVAREERAPSPAGGHGIVGAPSQPLSREALFRLVAGGSGQPPDQSPAQPTAALTSAASSPTLPAGPPSKTESVE
jgi:ATP-binding cassette, subfamily B, bacterial CvaB/MchF/RaxB